MEEVREHLIDAVDDGLGRGLSADDAEREAFERFGPPEAIAAHLIPGRHPMINRFVTLTRDVVWPHRWWILTPTVVTAILTSVLSYYYLPTRYRSESIIEIVSPQPVPAPLQSPAADQARARFQTISQTILNRSRLEWIIKDFGLYGAEQAQVPISNAVLQMRRDIAVEFLAGDARTENAVGGFKVSFESSNPTLALKITERLASLFVEENLRQREGQATGITQFLDAEIADVRAPADRARDLARRPAGAERRRAGVTGQSAPLRGAARTLQDAPGSARGVPGAWPTRSGESSANSSKWPRRHGCLSGRSVRAGWA